MTSGVLVAVAGFSSSPASASEATFEGRGGEGPWDGLKLRWVVIGHLVREVEVAGSVEPLDPHSEWGAILQALQIVRETISNEVIAKSIERSMRASNEARRNFQTLEG